MIITPTIILMMMLAFIFIMSFNKKNSSSLMSPFECGFNLPNKTKMPLSIQFSLTSFMFLIFDIELAILITSTWSMKSASKHWIIGISMFIILLLVSVAYEMMKNSSKWN